MWVGCNSSEQSLCWAAAQTGPVLTPRQCPSAGQPVEGKSSLCSQSISICVVIATSYGECAMRFHCLEFAFK